MQDAPPTIRKAAKGQAVGALWIGGSLSFLEQLCLKSFLDAGQAVVLFHYDTVENVPDGVEMADAADVLPLRAVLTHTRTGSPAPHADLFRYHLLARGNGLIWADTDAYCIRPFRTETGHFYGWESASHINNGVLGLPADSPALAGLLEFTRDEYAIPPWAPPPRQRRLREAAAAGNPVHVGDQPWGVWGPQALTHFLKQSGEAQFAMPTHALYPVPFKRRRTLLRPNFDLSGMITEDSISVHLYGRRMRRRIAAYGGVPKPRSWIGRALRRHGIDPSRAPLPPVKSPEERSEAEPVAEV